MGLSPQGFRARSDEDPVLSASEAAFEASSWSRAGTRRVWDLQHRFLRLLGFGAQGSSKSSSYGHSLTSLSRLAAE